MVTLFHVSLHLTFTDERTITQSSSTLPEVTRQMVGRAGTWLPSVFPQPTYGPQACYQGQERLWGNRVSSSASSLSRDLGQVTPFSLGPSSLLCKVEESYHCC